MKNKVLIGIIVVLIGVIAFEGIYLFNHWNKNSENNNIDTPNENDNGNNGDENINEETEDYVRLVNTREEDNQIVQEYIMVLNGKYQKFEINFEINEELDMPGYWTITALIDDVYLFSVYYDSLDLTVQNYVEYIEKYFNEDNFIIFLGTDGLNYLIIQTYILPPAGGVGIDYNIFNQNWDYIGDLSVIEQGQGLVLNDDNIWYQNNLNIDIAEDEYQIRSRIVNNQIYNLYFEGCYGGTMEERVYTINNNELEYEVINTYQVLEVAGAC